MKVIILNIILRPKIDHVLNLLFIVAMGLRRPGSFKALCSVSIFNPQSVLCRRNSNMAYLLIAIRTATLWLGIRTSTRYCDPVQWQASLSLSHAFLSNFLPLQYGRHLSPSWVCRATDVASMHDRALWWLPPLIGLPAAAAGRCEVLIHCCVVRLSPSHGPIYVCCIE